MFGQNTQQVRERFFEATWGNRLKFKEEYNTEKKIVEALRLPESASEAEKKFLDFLKQRLFLLINNVLLLLDVEDSNVFHPRYSFHRSSTFQELPEDWKRHFNDIHDDYFFHRQENLWRKEGMKKLPMMKSASHMLVCAEDLGLIPACVPEVMDETSIIGLRVQRMPVSSRPQAYLPQHLVFLLRGETNHQLLVLLSRAISMSWFRIVLSLDGDRQSDSAEFADPAKYPYATVATLSSHDTSTFRGWYEDELSADAKARYVKVPKRKNESASPRSKLNRNKMTVDSALSRLFHF